MCGFAFVHIQPGDVRHNLNSLSRVALVFQKHSSRGPRLRRTQGKLSWPHIIRVFQHLACSLQAWPCSKALRYSSESLRITLRCIVRVPSLVRITSCAMLSPQSTYSVSGVGNGDGKPLMSRTNRDSQQNQIDSKPAIEAVRVESDSASG
jgi:hypothetical protein